jgi:hypothetical protein
MKTAKETPYLQSLRRRLKHAQEHESQSKNIEDIQNRIDTWTSKPEADLNFFKYTPKN